MWREQRCQFVMPSIDPSVPGMAVKPSLPRLVALIPLQVDRPLLTFHRHGVVCRWPHVVLDLFNRADRVAALEVVRLAVELGESSAEAVVPVQLDKDASEAVGGESIFIPSLRHVGRVALEAMAT